VPTLDPSGAPKVIRRTRTRQVLNGLGVGLIAIVIAAGATAGIGMLLRAEEQTRPADPPPPPAEVLVSGEADVLPLEDVPSAPATGDLVMSFEGVRIPGRWASIYLYVYADGRMIWGRLTLPGDQYVERRLTPEGTELLRQEFLSTGLFERNLAVGASSSTGYSILRVRVQNAGRVVEVRRGFGRDAGLGTIAQARDLETLAERLADPSAWLPEEAWADAGPRAFVASRYLIRRNPVRTWSELPATATDVLRPTRCQVVSSAEALAITQGLSVVPRVSLSVGGWIPNAYRFTFEAGPTGAAEFFTITPALPHQTAC
jgi:hypothetical protein